MTVITQPDMLNTPDNNNKFMGELPKMVNSSIKFAGSNNILFCEKNVTLVNSTITFNANNSLIYLSESCKDYKVNLTVNNNSALYFGKNNYFNGIFTIILSEQKHFLAGDDGLYSFGIWARTADPHLIYDVESKNRINPSKSIFIGDHVWIGQNAYILKGTQIDSGSIVGAMSVLSGKRIPHNTSWAGNPAKQIKDNIFWNGACVHGWTDENTKKAQQNPGAKEIFKYSEKEYIPFDEIDYKLSDCKSSGEKLDYLTGLSSDKNRFVSLSDNKKDKPKKKWLF